MAEQSDQPVMVIVVVASAVVVLPRPACLDNRLVDRFEAYLEILR